jgi:hypothetical protein
MPPRFHNTVVPFLVLFLVLRRSDQANYSDLSPRGMKYSSDLFSVSSHLIPKISFSLHFFRLPMYVESWTSHGIFKALN